MFRQFFWMRALDAPTPKRSVLYSNTSWIAQLSFAERMKKHQLATKVKTTTQYKSKEGKQRFHGNSNLKKTQSLNQSV